MNKNSNDKAKVSCGPNTENFDINDWDWSNLFRTSAANCINNLTTRLPNHDIYRGYEITMVNFNYHLYNWVLMVLQFNCPGRLWLTQTLIIRCSSLIVGGTTLNMHMQGNNLCHHAQQVEYSLVLPEISLRDILVSKLMI